MSEPLHARLLEEAPAEQLSFSGLINMLKKSSIEEIDDRRKQIAILIPAVETMFNYDQKHSAHPYDLWMHSLHTVKNLPEGCDDDMLYLAALVHDIGKPLCRCKGKREDDPNMHYYGHPEKGAEMLEREIIPYCSFTSGIIIYSQPFCYLSAY